MSRSEILSDSESFKSIIAERDHLRKEVERLYAIERSVSDLKNAYESHGAIASRSLKIRDAINKLIGA